MFYFVREADPVRWPVGDSCKDILEKRNEFAGIDGTYTLVNKTTGTKYQAFCDMTSDGGGWTLAAKFSNYDKDHWVNSADDWTSAEVYGDTTNLILAGMDSKGLAWSSISPSQLLLRDSMSHNSYCVTEAGSYLGKPLNLYFQDVVDGGFPGYGGSCSYHERLPTTCSYIGPSSSASYVRSLLLVL